MEDYQVIRRINNNVVICSLDHHEVVAMGKGLGFKTYPGDFISEEDVERIFTPHKSSDSNIEEIAESISNISEESLAIADATVEYIEEKYKKSLHDFLKINLADHLEFAFQRIEQGIHLQSPFTDDLEFIYPKEYQMATSAIHFINENYDKYLGAEEVKFITMHFINATVFKNNEMPETVEITKITSEVTNFIYQYFDLEKVRTSSSFNRMVTHIRYFVTRYIKNEPNKDYDEQLYELIKNNFRKEWEGALAVKDYLEEKYGWNITTIELMYMTIHFSRLVNGGE